MHRCATYACTSEMCARTCSLNRRLLVGIQRKLPRTVVLVFSSGYSGISTHTQGDADLRVITLGYPRVCLR